MNTKYLLALCLFGATHRSCAMEAITLPKQKIIAQRLGNIGLGHFVETTNIDKTLGSKQRYPLEIGIEVESALRAYNKCLDNPQMTTFIQSRKSEIITVILQDYPKAIKSLKKDGTLEQ